MVYQCIKTSGYGKNIDQTTTVKTKSLKGAKIRAIQLLGEVSKSDERLNLINMYGELVAVKSVQGWSFC